MLPEIPHSTYKTPLYFHVIDLKGSPRTSAATAATTCSPLPPNLLTTIINLANLRHRHNNSSCSFIQSILSNIAINRIYMLRGSILRFFMFLIEFKSHGCKGVPIFYRF